MAGLGVPGFFGKLPSRGDFVTRRLASEFVTSWDAWLQRMIGGSRAELGNEWLDIYLTSPIWCFAVPAGTLGGSTYAGVMIPSVDKVGRYFPLSVAMSCGSAAPLIVRRALHEWYAQAQELMLETLAEPPLDADEFDKRLAALSVPLPSTALEWESSQQALDDPRSLAWQFQEADTDGGEELNAALLSQLLAHRDADAGVWWTAGSERVPGCTLFVSGLPSEPAFRAMLDGGFDSGEWSNGVLHRSAAKSPMDSTRWRVMSAARSEAGKVRPLNEDSFACRDEAGIWIVADGLGGHRAGEVASRMVASIAHDATESETFQQRVERLRGGAQVVNGCLRVFAEGLEAATVASTMAALVVVESKAAALWVGDSRVYRLRAGTLEQLTRDHAEEDSVDSILSGAGTRNRAVTRAVGGAADLDIDVVYESVYPEDRYLLCTDGLYTMISEAEIARALSLNSVEQACDELARLALAGAASDNITAVVVHVTHSSNESGGE